MGKGYNREYFSPFIPFLASVLAIGCFLKSLQRMTEQTEVGHATRAVLPWLSWASRQHPVRAQAQPRSPCLHCREVGYATDWDHRAAHVGPEMKAPAPVLHLSYFWLPWLLQPLRQQISSWKMSVPPSLCHSAFQSNKSLKNCCPINAS